MPYVPPFWEAVVHVGLGETASAIDALNRGLDEPDGWMTHLLMDPLLEPIRDEPEYSALLSRVGLKRRTSEAESG